MEQGRGALVAHPAHPVCQNTLAAFFKRRRLAVRAGYVRRAFLPCHFFLNLCSDLPLPAQIA